MTAYSRDRHLKYNIYRYNFDNREKLKFDETYCLQQLPLVNPDHPKVLHRNEVSDYKDGYYDQARNSLVVLIPLKKLLKSESFRMFHNDVVNAPFGSKINWRIFDRRLDLTHITICRGLSEWSLTDIKAQTKSLLKALDRTYKVQVRGAFIGKLNTGRIYLKSYPEILERETNIFQKIQYEFDKTPSAVYPLGLYNVFEELDSIESHSLRMLIKKYWNSNFAEINLTSNSLAIIKTHNDLILDSTILRLE